MERRSSKSMRSFDWQHRPASILHLPDDFLNALTIVDRAVSANPQPVTEEALQKQEDTQTIPTEDGDAALECRTCNVKFDLSDKQEHRKHYATDWHRYNIKRKITLGLTPVSQEEFEEMLSDLSESISGSEENEEEDDSDSDDNGQDNLNALIDKQQRAMDEAAALKEATSQDNKVMLLPVAKKFSSVEWFAATSITQNFVFGVYRTLLSSTSLNALQAKHYEGRPRYWTVIMLGGGHFAGGVVDVNRSIRDVHSFTEPEVKLIAHRTIHRYTTRRKQGGAQSANDNAKGAANSAGAQIRRYNEAKLKQEVQEILQEWKSHIEASEFVFLHAPSNNKKIVFGYEGAVLSRENSKIRNVPFTTRRPTLNEIRRVFIELCTLKVVETDIVAHQQKLAERVEQLNLGISRTQKTNAPPRIQEPTATTTAQSPELEKLFALVKQGKEQLVLSHIRKYEASLLQISRSKLLPTEDIDLQRFPSLLHLAAHWGHPLLVNALIRELDADPTIKNEAGKTAYDVCKGKDTRNAFRRCMCDLPDRWDWLNEAHVPSPLTREAELAQAEKERKQRERDQERRRKIEEERMLREEKEREKQLEQKIRRGGQVLSSPMGAQRLGGPSASNAAINMASMTPEARQRMEREMRARAAEQRMRRQQQQQQQ